MKMAKANKISKLQVVSNIKLQTMSGSKRRMWRRRGGSNRISFISSASLEQNHVSIFLNNYRMEQYMVNGMIFLN